MFHKVGERLSSNRKQRNMSQEELATLLNVSRQTVSKWETGDTLPDLYNAVALAKLFHVTLDQFVLGSKGTYGESSYFSQLKEKRKQTNFWAIVVGSIGSIILTTAIILFQALDFEGRTVGILFAILIPVIFACYIFAIWGFIKTGRLNNEIKYLEKMEMISLQMGHTQKQEPQ